jgi:hypothetical protein
MPGKAEEPVCVWCGQEVRVNRDSFELLERMHFVCFYYEFEHTGFDPDEECDARGCPFAVFSTPLPRRGAPRDKASGSAR